jgi:hypothetical protein
MANDTGQPKDTSTALAPTDGGAVSVFASEANFTSAQRMAKALMSSDMMPQSFRGSMSNTLIAMELAARTGASVLMVAQNLDVIHGRPAWRSSFLIACINNSGRFTPLRFVFEGAPGGDAWGCRATAKDRETGDLIEGPLVTIAMAKAEGWSSKNGSKWKTMPELMLRYRAAAFFARTCAPELSLGMQTSDEVQDVFGAGLPNESAAALPEALKPKGAAALNETIGLATPVTQIIDADGVVLDHPPAKD